MTTERAMIYGLGVGVPLVLLSIYTRQSRKTYFPRAVRKALAKNESVASILGGPITTGRYTGDLGPKHAVLTMPCSGASSKGNLRVQAMLDDEGKWRVLTCTLDVEGRNRRVPIKLTAENEPL